MDISGVQWNTRRASNHRFTRCQEKLFLSKAIPMTNSAILPVILDNITLNLHRANCYSSESVHVPEIWWCSDPRGRQQSHRTPRPILNPWNSAAFPFFLCCSASLSSFRDAPSVEQHHPRWGSDWRVRCLRALHGRDGGERWSRRTESPGTERASVQGWRQKIIIKTFFSQILQLQYYNITILKRKRSGDVFVSLKPCSYSQWLLVSVLTLLLTETCF